MHPEFLDLLCCPETGSPLHLEACESLSNGVVISGGLRSDDGRRYPIIDGVPRFVTAEGYAASFGDEWTRWPRVQFESDNLGRPLEGHTTRMWEVCTGRSRHDVKDRVIGEFGCGPGRFLDVVRGKGGRAIGVELTRAADVARRNLTGDPNVLILQADILAPPLRRGCLDGVYSIGVLHHTPDPRRGLCNMTRAVRDGGWVACCVYPRGGFYDSPSVARFRRAHSRVEKLFGCIPALGYSYLAAYVLAPLLYKSRSLPRMDRVVKKIEREILPLLNVPDARWRVLDVFDAITPAIATTHTEEEVRGWMTAAGCQEIRTTDWCETSLVGVKGAVQ